MIRITSIDLSSNTAICSPMPPSLMSVVNADATSIGMACANQAEAVLLLVVKAELGNPPELSEWVTGEDPVFASSSPTPGLVPPSLANITSLTSIKLTDSSLMLGNLPGQWSALAGLQHLEVVGTGALGRLPSAWSTLTQLTYLRVASNSITNALSQSWRTLQGLVTLDLSDNDISGSLPDAWSSLSHLTDLNLASNRLTSSLPPSWTATAPAGMAALQFLTLAFNTELCGDLPTTGATVVSDGTTLGTPCVAPLAPLFTASANRFLESVDELPVVPGVVYSISTRNVQTSFTVPRSSRAANCKDETLINEVLNLVALLGLPVPNISVDCNPAGDPANEPAARRRLNDGGRRSLLQEVKDAYNIASSYNLDFTVDPESSSHDPLSLLPYQALPIQPPDPLFQGLPPFLPALCPGQQCLHHRFQANVACILASSYSLDLTLDPERSSHDPFACSRANAACILASSYSLDFTLDPDRSVVEVKSELQKYIKAIVVPACPTQDIVFYDSTTILATTESKGAIPVDCSMWSVEASALTSDQVLISECMIPPPAPPVLPTPSPILPEVAPAKMEGGGDEANIGLIVGVAVGGFFALLALTCCCCWWFACGLFRRRKKKDDEQKKTDPLAAKEKILESVDDGHSKTTASHSGDGSRANGAKVRFLSGDSDSDPEVEMDALSQTSHSSAYSLCATPTASLQSPTNLNPLATIPPMLSRGSLNSAVPPNRRTRSHHHLLPKDLPKSSSRKSLFGNHPVAPEAPNVEPRERPPKNVLGGVALEPRPSPSVEADGASPKDIEDIEGGGGLEPQPSPSV
eukprot:gene30703-35728_t